MDTNFWQQKWETNQIAFHEPSPNQLLINYLPALSIKKGQRVFLPLCGKTLDISWLLSAGYRIAGAELVEGAVTQLFEDLGMDPAISRLGEIKHYSAKNIDLFVGDIFKLTKEELGAIDAVYDRAALVALPAEMRHGYAKHIAELTGQSPILLISYQYDQDKMQGPPFSVSREEIQKNYGDDYHINELENRNVPGGLKGKCEAKERVWLLQPLK